MGKSPRTIRRPGNKNTKSAWKRSSKRKPTINLASEQVETI